MVKDTGGIYLKLGKLINLAKLIKIDSKKGKILIRDKSVLILPVGVSPALNRGLSKVVGKSVATPLYHSGKEIGNSVFDLFIRIYGTDVIKSEDKFKKAIENFLPLGGFGRLEVIEIDFENGKFVIRGWGFPEVISITSSEDHVCHQLRGISARFMEKITDKPCEGKEVRCQAKGDEYCEIEIKSKG